MTAVCLQPVRRGEEDRWLDSDQLHAGLASRRKGVGLQRETQKNRRRGEEEEEKPK